MTREEVAKLIYVVKATYPRAFSSYTDADTKNMLAAWHMVLGHYDYASASKGLRVYLANDTKGFPPSPGQVIDGIQKAQKPAEQDMMRMIRGPVAQKALAINLRDDAFSHAPPLSAA